MKRFGSPLGSGECYKRPLIKTEHLDDTDIDNSSQPTATTSNINKPASSHFPPRILLDSTWIPRSQSHWTEASTTQAPRPRLVVGSRHCRQHRSNTPYSDDAPPRSVRVCVGMRKVIPKFLLALFHKPWCQVCQGPSRSLSTLDRSLLVPGLVEEVADRSIQGASVRAHYNGLSSEVFLQETEGLGRYWSYTTDDIVRGLAGFGFNLVPVKGYRDGFYDNIPWQYRRWGYVHGFRVYEVDRPRRVRRSEPRQRPIIQNPLRQRTESYIQSFVNAGVLPDLVPVKQETPDQPPGSNILGKSGEAPRVVERKVQTTIPSGKKDEDIITEADQENQTWINLKMPGAWPVSP